MPKSRFSRALLTPRFEGAKGYFLAFLAVVAAFAVRLVLEGFLDDRAVLILFAPAILAASIAGGLGPGLAAVVFSLPFSFYLAGPQAVAICQHVPNFWFLRSLGLPSPGWVKRSIAPAA